ncbi:MAG: hypothetical protein ACFB6R_00170 [Alphaproteobacteria bacterium]
MTLTIGAVAQPLSALTGTDDFTCAAMGETGMQEETFTPVVEDPEESGRPVQPEDPMEDPSGQPVMPGGEALFF